MSIAVLPRGKVAMSFESALALMTDWTDDLDQWIRSNEKQARPKGDIERAYESAVWILDISGEDQERAWLKLKKPKQLTQSGITPATLLRLSIKMDADKVRAIEDAIVASGRELGPRQVYARDIAAAEVVTRYIESLVSPRHAQIIRRLAAHQPQRQVAAWARLAADNKRLRELRDNAWRDIYRALDRQDEVALAA
jgi:hypothetical protein